jgi:acetyltransferase-like isoleucine patch superfamily enzyme
MPAAPGRRVPSPWLRAVLQGLFHRVEKLREDVLAIEPGDALATRFAEFGEGSRIDTPRVALINPELVAIGRHVEIRSGVCIEAYAPPGEVVLRLGDRVVVGHNVRFVAVNGIEIAEDCGIGHGTTIADTIHDWPEVLGGVPASRSSFVAGPPLRIERGAWIGNNCQLYRGITIGERAIVAPGSVVTRDVPPETMVSGNPGRRVPYPPLLSGSGEELDPTAEGP